MVSAPCILLLPIIAFTVAVCEEIPPSRFEQFRGILEHSRLKNAKGSVVDNLTDYSECSFKSLGLKAVLPDYITSLIKITDARRQLDNPPVRRFAVNESGHLSILEQTRRMYDGRKAASAWSSSEHRNGFSAEVYISPQRDDVDDFTFLSVAANGPKPSDTTVLVRLAWKKSYKGHSDVIVAHYRLTLQEGGHQAHIIGPRKDSVVKYLCEVSENKIFLSVDDEPVEELYEKTLARWEENRFWSRAGVILYDAKTNVSAAQSFFKSLKWL